MRVLFINTRISVGADVAVHLGLIEHLDPSMCKVVFATNSRANDLEQTIERLKALGSVRTLTLDLGREVALQTRLGKLTRAYANVRDLARSIWKLSMLVRRERIDIIHTTDRPRDALVGLLVARLGGCKNLVHVHNKWFTGIGRISEWAVHRSDGILAISQFVRRSLVDGGVPRDRIHTVLNATDAQAFAPDVHPSGFLRERLGLGSDTPLIGMVGRIMVWKGQLELVEAMAQVKRQVPQAHLAIVGFEDRYVGAGGESYGDRVMRRASDLGLANCVHRAGWFKNIADLYVDMDVVCVPSYEEPFGLVVTEAMAMERPVVGFAAGALPEIIRVGVDGFLAPALDVDQLAGAIVKLLVDRDLRQEMGRNGRARVLSEFTPERQAREVLDVYQKVLGRHKMACQREVDCREPV